MTAYAHTTLIAALDVSTLPEARTLVSQLRGKVGLVKVGLQLLHNAGTPTVLQMLHDEGMDVMVDAKLSDIPNTMTKAMESIMRFNPKFITIHTSAGPESIKAAVAVAASGLNTTVLGVTVLTSMDEDASWQVFNRSPIGAVVSLAKLLADCRVGGIVCSPKELGALNTFREVNSLIRVVPGIRPTWANPNDQARIMTPAKAIRAGANYLVIGRPITNPPADIGSPTAAAVLIAEEIEAEFARRKD